MKSSNRVELRKRIAEQNKAIFAAAKSRDKIALKNFKIYGYDLNVTDRDGCNIMHLAAADGADVDFLRFLKVECGLGYTTHDTIGRTPAHHAAMNGHLSAFIHLSAGFNPNNKASYMTLLSPDKNKKSTLHTAAEKAHVDIIQTIFKHCPADMSLEDLIMMADNQGMNTLHYLAISGSVDTLNSVTQHLNNTHDALSSADIEGRDSLIHAARADQAQMVKHLLVHFKMNLHTKCKAGNLAMHHCVTTRAKNSMETLVACGASYEDENPKIGSKPILVACRKGFQDMFEFLEGKGVNIQACDKFGQNGWFYAAANDNVDMLHFLSSKKLEKNLRTVNNRKINPLHFAALSGHLKNVKFFMKNWEGLNVADEENKTPEDHARDKLIHAEQNHDKDLHTNLELVIKYFEKKRGLKHVDFKSTQSLVEIKQIEKRENKRERNDQATEKKPSKLKRSGSTFFTIQLRNQMQVNHPNQSTDDDHQDKINPQPK